MCRGVEITWIPSGAESENFLLSTRRYTYVYMDPLES